MNISGDWKKLMREYQRKGWTITRTGKGHYRWLGPHGGYVVTSSSPSCPFALTKVRKSLRRMEEEAA